VVVRLKKIDHLGVAVRDLNQQVEVYRDKLGMEFQGIEEVPTEMVRTAFFQVGDVRVELLEPTSPESPIAKHLEKRGEGLHHIAYEVDDIRAAIAEAKANGLEPLSDEPRPGAHNTLVCFLHPKATGKVLTELVQKTAK